MLALGPFVQVPTRREPFTRGQQGIDAEGLHCDRLCARRTIERIPACTPNLRARFGLCNDHIWPLNAFKMVLRLVCVLVPTQPIGRACLNLALVGLEATCGHGRCPGCVATPATARPADRRRAGAEQNMVDA